VRDCSRLTRLQVTERIVLSFARSDGTIRTGGAGHVLETATGPALRTADVVSLIRVLGVVRDAGTGRVLGVLAVLGALGTGGAAAL